MFASTLYAIKQRKLKRSFYIVLIILISFSASAQLSPEHERQVDSLQKIISNAKHDTTIIDALWEWDIIIYESDPDLDYKLLQKMDSLCSINLTKELKPKERYSFLEAKSFVLDGFGLIHYDRNEYENAIGYFSQSLKVMEELADTDGIFSTLEIIGISYSELGEYDKAIEYQIQCLNMLEEVGNKSEISSVLNEIGISYYEQGKYDKAIVYYSQSLKINEEIGNKDGISDCMVNIGGVYRIQGDFAKAIECYTQSLEIKKEIGDKPGISSCLLNLGNVYKNQGDFERAVEYYSQSLKIKEQVGDKKGVALVLNKFGNIYSIQGDFEKAIDYQSQSLEIYEEIGYQRGKAIALHSIGLIHQDQGEYDKAMEFYSQSLKIKEEIGNEQGKANTLLCLGNTYFDQDSSFLAMEYYVQALKIQEEIEDKSGIANSLNCISLIYEEQGNYSKALDYASRSLSVAQEMGEVSLTRDASRSLWKSNRAIGRYKEALFMHELYISSRDSLVSEANQKAIIRQEYKYEYEKQAAADSVQTVAENKIKDAEIAANKAETRAQKQQKIYLYIGLGLVALFGMFMFNRFRTTSKQKVIIEEQKFAVENQKIELEKTHLQLEEHHREISDSINYAKRIQEAIMPSLSAMKAALKNGFVMYLPKDVVAGDFFYMEQIEDCTYFAVADCTGHGVPGAMVSVVCNNALNKALLEEGIREPGMLLDRTREIVISALAKSGEEVKDGMDIALCSLQENKLAYAGANNPLWLIRNGEIIETKANKQPIGMYSNPVPFTTHDLNLQEGDSIYLFSDGYVDQFGGEKGKKFKPSNLRKLLLSVQDKPMEEQKTRLEQAFKNWMGSLEQIDDVCVIGVRI